jgi:hypothetical protein
MTKRKNNKKVINSAFELNSFFGQITQYTTQAVLCAIIIHFYG